VSLTGGNRNDVTQLLPLLDKIPAVAGRVGRPRRRPDMLFADRGYDHDKYRRLLRQRGIRPVIAEWGQPHGTGLGTFRWVVERTISWLHGFRRLRIRWETRMPTGRRLRSIDVDPEEARHLCRTRQERTLLLPVLCLLGHGSILDRRGATGAHTWRSSRHRPPAQPSLSPGDGEQAGHEHVIDHLRDNAWPGKAPAPAGQGTAMASTGQRQRARHFEAALAAFQFTVASLKRS
jgi:transposase